MTIHKAVVPAAAGDRLDYLTAVVQIAVDRPDLGPDFRAWWGDFTGTLGKPLSD